MRVYLLSHNELSWSFVRAPAAEPESVLKRFIQLYPWQAGCERQEGPFTDYTLASQSCGPYYVRAGAEALCRSG